MRNEQESHLGRLYRQTYNAICGRHPFLRPWHFQWLGTFYLVRSLKKLTPLMSGRVLDVGCGEKPYRPLFSQAREYIGIDIEGEADFLVAPDSAFPFDDDAFDVVFSTQVLEHVENLPHTLEEIARVCKPGGTVLLSVPFLYNEHGTPCDFRRFTGHGATRLIPFEVMILELQGGIGSTTVTLILNWINDVLNTTKPLRFFKAANLPIWVPFCFAMNTIGFLLDRLDPTGRYYNNVLVVFKKPYRIDSVKNSTP